MFKFLKKQQQQEYANPSKRFLAYSIDLLIVTMCRYTMFLLFLFIWFRKSIENVTYKYHDLANQGYYNIDSNKDFLTYILNHNILIEILFVFAVIFFIGSLYWIILPTTKFRGTFGKYWLKIAIVKENNHTLSMSKAIFRYFVGLVPWLFHIVIIICFFSKNIPLLLASMIIVTLWYDASIFRVSRRAMHDYICKTKVIKSNFITKSISS